MNSTRGGHSISGPLQQVQQRGSRKRVIEDVGSDRGKGGGGNKIQQQNMLTQY